VLREFYQILKTDGILYISVQKGSDEKWRTGPYSETTKRWFTYWPSEAIEDQLTESGFEILDRQSNESQSLIPLPIKNDLARAITRVATSSKLQMRNMAHYLQAPHTPTNLTFSMARAFPMHSTDRLCMIQATSRHSSLALANVTCKKI